MNTVFTDIRQHTIVEPASLTSGVVFALPHSGRDYGVSFLNQSILNRRSIRSSEDAFLDKLIDGIEKYGAPTIIANAPRAFIDLNRSTDELDPALISGIKNSIRNPRVSSGLGVIPRVVAHGKEIYRGKLSFEQAQSRIAYYWKPYHKDLSDLLKRAQSIYGQSLLIDLHSMPHEAVSTQSSFIKAPEIVVGDRFGMSSDSEFTNLVISILKQHGFRVAKNTPFAGAFITKHHGKIKERIHAIQLEIDRSLYMNEEQVSPNSGFETLKLRLFPALIQISSLICKSEKIAAE
jgi:N-formylglutamate deformylase